MLNFVQKWSKPVALIYSRSGRPLASTDPQLAPRKAVGGFWMLNEGVKIGSLFSESPILATSRGIDFALQDRFPVKSSEGGALTL